MRGLLEHAMCTRVLYEAGNQNYFVGRTMDWFEETQTDLWAFPRGMERDGNAGPNSIKWRSNYGSVVADIYNLGTADGMNEAGLITNILYLVEADYGVPDGSGKPLLSIGGWAQYIIDNYGTVAEAVSEVRREPFALVAPDLPGGKPASGHIALADPTGDSAILEYIGGELRIHHGPQYRVMTNSPPYDDQLAINTYWKEVGGLKMLPGTHRAADRFARVSWNLEASPKVIDRRQATAVVFSIIRNISVPLGITDPEKPNLSSTRWRTVADSKDKRYFFESTLSPVVFWVDLEKLQLEPEAKPMKLDLSGNPIIAGEVSGKFEPTEPFPFIS